MSSIKSAPQTKCIITIIIIFISFGLICILISTTNPLVSPVARREQLAGV